jgi:iron(III) transport system substrate-binding protein
MRFFSITLIIVFLVIFICSCGKSNEVVVYASADSIYAKEIISAFEKETGISVKLLTDSESNKGAHFLGRIIEEMDRPVADVYWNNEISRTLILASKGALVLYKSPSAVEIPNLMKEPSGLWTAFSARARVIVYNTELILPEDAPKSILELADPKWASKTVIANPAAGTTASHVAAIFLQLGDEKAAAFFRRLAFGGARMVASNSQVRDFVARGEALVGLTDTDDVWEGIENKKPVAMIYPDQDTFGTLVIPNSAMLIKNGPNPDNGKRFLDYLLSKRVEAMLAKGRARQIPVRGDVQVPEGVLALGKIKPMNITYAAISAKMESASRIVREIFQASGN